MQTIGIIAQKGGTGKTTTAAALWGMLTGEGRRVLAVDMDPQGSLSLIAGSKGTPGKSLVQALTGKVPARDVIEHTEHGDLIPAEMMLTAADKILSGSVTALKSALAPLANDYDYAILDAPPGLGILLLNVLTAADWIVIPVQADLLSLNGLSQIAETVAQVRARTNPALRVAGVLLSRHNARSRITRAATAQVQALAARLEMPVFRAAIRETVIIREAQTVQQPLDKYAPCAAVTEDLKSFAAELLERMKGAQKA